MNIKLIKKRDLKIGTYEIRINTSIYYVYVSYNKDDITFTDFYIKEENSGFIKFCVSVKWQDKANTIEKFIDDNIIGWIVKCNIDMDVLGNNIIDMPF